MKLLEIFSIIDEERALLFELRNVVNNQEVKRWADVTAHRSLAQPFSGTDAFEQVYNWGKKALLKWVLENAPGEPVRMDPTQRIADVGGNNFKRLEELPEWMQQALLRGDELTWIDTKDLPRSKIASDVMKVADWLRYKYQTEPRTFTRLNRIPWHEALRLTQEYHSELERKRPRDINEMVEWFRQNPDEAEAVKDAISKDSGYLATTFQNTLDTDEEYNYSGFLRTFGSRIFNLIQKAFKNATGFSVALPKDDPSGRVPYLRYDDKGGFLPPEPEKEPDPYLQMDWGDEQDQDALAGAEKVDHDDFEPAPEFGPGWYKLTTQKCVDYEGAVMGHCVAGYGREVEAGNLWIFSLRDKDNMPHVTIEVKPKELRLKGPNSPVIINQIKGRENQPPVAKYHPEVIDFIRKLKEEYPLLKIDINEGQTDMHGMSMIVHEDEEGDKIYQYDPPFNQNGFHAYAYEIKYEDEDTEEEFDEPIEIPLDDPEPVEGGSFPDAIGVLWNAGFEDWDTGAILKYLASGNSLWTTQFDDYGAESAVTISYGIKGDHYTRRRLKRVL